MDSKHDAVAAPRGRLTGSRLVSDRLTSEPRREYRSGDGGDGRNAAPANDLEAFAQWFADWWLRRGQHLTNPDHTDTGGPARRTTATFVIDGAVSMLRHATERLLQTDGGRVRSLHIGTSRSALGPKRSTLRWPARRVKTGSGVNDGSDGGRVRSLHIEGSRSALSHRRSWVHSGSSLGRWVHPPEPRRDRRPAVNRPGLSGAVAVTPRRRRAGRRSGRSPGSFPPPCPCRAWSPFARR
jgi:hypothetical protein